MSIVPFSSLSEEERLDVASDNYLKDGELLDITIDIQQSNYDLTKEDAEFKLKALEKKIDSNQFSMETTFNVDADSYSYYIPKYPLVWFAVNGTFEYTIESGDLEGFTFVYDVFFDEFDISIEDSYDENIWDLIKEYKYDATKLSHVKSDSYEKVLKLYNDTFVEEYEYDSDLTKEENIQAMIEDLDEYGYIEEDDDAFDEAFDKFISPYVDEFNKIKDESESIARECERRLNDIEGNLSYDFADFVLNNCEDAVVDTDTNELYLDGID